MNIVRRAAIGGAGVLAAAGAGALYGLHRINQVRAFPAESLSRLRNGRSNPLFDRYPRLSQRIPWTPLGTFPTVVEPLRDARVAHGVDLYVKRDDLSAELYGGNKVRKLEYLLAEAKLSGADTLITLGALGSNHALAVAAQGRQNGFEVDLVLYDQPVTPFVLRNLGGFLAAGARLHYAGTIVRAFTKAAAVASNRSREGKVPYFIMVGGTSRLGCLGYVTAAFELAEQLRAGELPEPDAIFVALGTCGTAAGLVAGLKLAGLRTRVLAVRVAEAISANSTVVRLLAQDAADFLHRCDPSVPRVQISSADFDVLPQYLGPGYGHPTDPCQSAVQEVASSLALETTYTGKALAACLDFCRVPGNACNVLFWNTFSSTPVPEPSDWSGLPPRLGHLARKTHRHASSETGTS